MFQRILYILFATSYLSMATQAQLVQVNNFGTNPGNLAMYRYTPGGISNDAPLVIALHGCTQNAATYATESGWNELADRYKFHVVYAEQNSGNNSSRCFNWFETGDITRDQGEARSIKSMVDYMKSNYPIAPTKVFVTGFSAGGGMATAMLATYPDVFAGGSINAGLPYKAATSLTNAFAAMGGNVNKTPQQWGNLVRGQLPSFSGTYPKVAVFHGSSDFTVNNQNVGEIVEQWINLHNTNANADATVNNFNGNANITQKRYNNTSGKTVVITYDVNGMVHTIAVDPGTGTTQGGQTGAYASDRNFYSSYWAADFFGIINPSNGTVPLAPSDLSASPNSSSDISLNWTDNANNEAGYVVERSTTSGSGFVEIATLGANTTGFNDSGLSANTTYYYRVKASNTQGSSNYSNETQATTQTNGNGGELPDAPTGLGGSSGSSSEISLSWTDNANNETAYLVERSTNNNNNFNQIASLNANATTYNDSGLSANTTYYYRVKAGNAQGSSSYSNETQVTTSSTGGGTSYTIAQTNGNFYITTLNNASMGQSFTIPQSGVITKITAKFRQAISNSTLHIFTGNTVGGTPIYTQNGVNAGAGIQGVNLSTPLPVNAGQTYTFQFTNASLAYTFSNVYSGGSYWYNTIQYTVFDAYFVIDATANNTSNRFTQTMFPFDQTTPQIAPNPTSRYVNITGIKGQQVSIEIKDSQGRIVKSQQVNSSLDMGSLSSGLYFVSISTNNQTTTQKVWVQKD